MRFVFFMALLAGAYKVGEQKARLETMDFLITIGAGYLLIENNTISIVPDMNLATQFSYFDAINLKRILKKTNPNIQIGMEGISGIINAIHKA